MVNAAVLAHAASIALATCSAGLCLWSVIGLKASQWQQGRLRGLKVARMVAFCILLGSQAAVLAVQLLEKSSSSRLSLAEQGCTLASLITIVGALIYTWRQQAALNLMPLCGVLLAQCGSLLASDILQLQGNGPDGMQTAAIVALAVHASQILLLLGLLLTELILGHAASLSTEAQSPSDPGLQEPLLGPSANGAAIPNSDSAWCGTKAALGPDGEPAPKKVKAKKAPALTRWQMTAAAMRYVWPDSQPLRVRLLFCFILVILERAVNLAVPWSQKQMIDQLTQASVVHSHIGPLLAAATRSGVLGGVSQESAAGGQAAIPGTAAVSNGGMLNSTAQALATGGVQVAGRWGRQMLGRSTLPEMLTAFVKEASKTGFWNVFYPYVLAYLGFYFLRGGSGSEGLLANIRDLVWIPITQAAFRRISMDIFGHLLELDHNFHLHRKTGQIMRILDRGTSSIQDTVTIVLFNVVPQLIDIIVACGYLSVYMQPWAGGIVFITVASYVPLTVLITERRGVVRKKMNALDNAREGRATDMLLNYETVKYFTNEKFELSGYDNATIAYQAMEYLQMVFLSVLSIVQSSVVWVGLAAGMVVCVYGVTQGTLTVGDAVLFVTMVNQLYVPLTFFGSYYRQVQKALIDMENMFELLHTVPLVRDAPDARPLAIREGKVEFRNVTFGYNAAMPVLKGVSFGVPGGKTMAVVGATGSGKSTILRLLLRFYDPQGGAVLIDDQDIAKASQDSVRGAIAVVPQDTVLFNDTIGYNIRYGRTNAGDAEVVAAARVAHIHSAIASFKKGYNTKVGERGLRLSGGEKQRVAFARAVLKRPAILILDEATSALDSLTELAIQSSLAEMRNKCTTVIVAHRLSTILDADVIVVLSNGLVAQVGSHSELLKETSGLYSAMWSRQGDSVPSAGELLQMQTEQAERVKATDAAAAARMVLQGKPLDEAAAEASEAGRVESAAAAVKNAKLEAARSSSSSNIGISIPNKGASNSSSVVGSGGAHAVGSSGAAVSGSLGKASGAAGKGKHSGAGGRVTLSLDAVGAVLQGLQAQREAAGKDDGQQGSSSSSSGEVGEPSCSTSSGPFAAAAAEARSADSPRHLPPMPGSDGNGGSSSSRRHGPNGANGESNNGGDGSSSSAVGPCLRSSLGSTSVNRKHVGFSRFVDPHALPQGMAGTLGSSPGSSVILDIGELEDDSSRRPTPGRRHNERLHPARYDSSADLTTGADDDDDDEDSPSSHQETAARARELVLRDGSMPRLPGLKPVPDEPDV